MDESKLMDFVGTAVSDVGAFLGGALVVIGDKLGLYRAMAGAGPITAEELAKATGTAPRYVLEWLSAQASRGYVTYEGDGRFLLPDEHAVPLTDETSPACVIGRIPGVAGRHPGGRPSRCGVPHRRRARLARTTTTYSPAPSGSSGPDTSPA